VTLITLLHFIVSAQVSTKALSARVSPSVMRTYCWFHYPASPTPKAPGHRGRRGLNRLWLLP